MAQTDIRTLREIIRDGLESRGLTPQRLAELADIPERYVIAICEGDVKHLPPAPYVRGYLAMIGGFLNLDGQALWRLYKEEFPIRSSGGADTLPANRFAAQSSLKKPIIFAISLILIAYAGWRLPAFIGKPSIELLNPPISPMVVRESSIRLVGNIGSYDALLVNNQAISVDSNGHFEKEWPLEPGMNGLQLVVKRFLGKETKLEQQIIYQPQ